MALSKKDSTSFMPTLLKLLRDTFYPPEAWLRLYYGLGSGPALWWGRMVRHPLHIMGRVGNYLTGQIKRKKA